jgi:hypothetical protein
MSWNEFKNIYSVEKNTKFKEEKIGSINSEIDVDIKQIIDLVDLRNLEAHSSIIEIYDQMIVIDKAKKLLVNLPENLMTYQKEIEKIVNLLNEMEVKGKLKKIK